MGNYFLDIQYLITKLQFYINKMKDLTNDNIDRENSTKIQTKILLEKGFPFAASLIGREKLMGPRNLHFFIQIMVIRDKMVAQNSVRTQPSDISVF